MNLFVSWLNHSGESLVRTALGVAWQCTVLVLILALLDKFIRNCVRAAFRYGLWLLLPIKLLLPPTLAVPTSFAYWLPATQPAEPPAERKTVTRTFPDEPTLTFPATPVTPPVPVYRAHLQVRGIVCVVWFLGMLAVAAILISRALDIQHLLRRSRTAPDRFSKMLEECRIQMPTRIPVQIRLSSEIKMPAVCGLLRPIIVIPAALTEQLSAAQWRSVILHELAHVRRGDLWVLHVQCLLQIVYWWHPFVWFANAAICRTREQAVDEQVMVALGHESDEYPATLLEIARKIAPTTRLTRGLVGIFEPGKVIKTRIRRLVDRPMPPSATLSLKQLALLALTALCVLPMNAARDRVPLPQTDTATSPIPQKAIRGADQKGVVAANRIRLEFPEIDPVTGMPLLDPTSKPIPTPPLSALRTRTFKVDRYTLARGVGALKDNSMGSSDSLDFADERVLREGLVDAVRAFLERKGVELTPPRSLVYHNLGLLVVRATPEELNILEQSLQGLLASPPQINIEARFVEVTEGQPAATEISRVLGFDIDSKIGSTISTDRFPNANDQNAALATNLGPPVFTRILTPAQNDKLLGILKQSNGADILASQRVTTLSDRQAQIKTIEIKPVVTGMKQPDKPGDKSRPVIESFEFGPMLDVVPSFTPDGSTIRMSMIPILREFLGYDGAPNLNPISRAPMFRTRQATCATNVLDGQTVAIGLGHAPSIPKSGERSVSKNLIVFITPTLIDPAGNRLYPGKPNP